MIAAKLRPSVASTTLAISRAVGMSQFREKEIPVRARPRTYLLTRKVNEERTLDDACIANYKLPLQ